MSLEETIWKQCEAIGKLQAQVDILTAKLNEKKGMRKKDEKIKQLHKALEKIAKITDYKNWGG